MKKLLSLLLAAMMMANITPILAAADETVPDDAPAFDLSFDEAFADEEFVDWEDEAEEADMTVPDAELILPIGEDDERISDTGEAVFEKGYTVVAEGAEVYASPEKTEMLGVFTEESFVYAEAVEEEPA